MTNVLIIPTSGLMEFNASAAAGGFSGTLDNTYANAVRLDIANSATLRVLGKNATNNERLVVSGTNGIVLKVRDVSAAGSASASVETPIMSATYVSAGTVSATNYLNLPVLGEGQFVELSGDTMTGKLILSGTTSSTQLLEVSGSALISGTLSSVTVSAVSARFTDLSATEIDSPTISGTNISALTNLRGGNISGTTVTALNNINASSFVATSAFQGPTVSATNISGITEVSSPSIRGGSVSAATVSAVNNMNASSFVAVSAFQGAIVSATNISGITQVSSPSIRGGSVSAATVSALNNMNASSFVGTSAVSTPSAYHTTLSSNSISSTNVTALNNINASSFVGTSAVSTPSAYHTTLSSNSISSTNVTALNNINASSFVAVSAFQGAVVSATNISGITEVSSPSIRGGSVSAATVSALNNMNASSFVGTSAVSTPSAYHTTLSSNSISATNVTALNNINASSFIGTSAVQAPAISGTTISALNNINASSVIVVSSVSAGVSLRGGNISGTTISALNNINASSFVAASAVSAPSAYTNFIGGNDADINLSTNGTIKLNATAIDISGGDLSVTGNFKATAKSFLIDHPTPNSGYSKLQYACLEGPENGVYVRGKADAAKADHIVLPYYWIDLVHADSITVQITPTNPEQKLYVEKIEDNKVYIKDTMVGDDGLTKSEYFYIVHGERKDINHLIVEY